MTVLLDTHALLWWLVNDRRLGSDARSVIQHSRNRILVSAVSLWEIAIKVRLGKLEADLDDIAREIGRNHFEPLAISVAHLVALRAVPQHHKDPFDHLLIAQALVEKATLLSDDRALFSYDVRLMRCAGEKPGW